MSRRSRGHDDAVAAPQGRFREAGAADSPQPGRGAAAICFRGERPDAGERPDTDERPDADAGDASHLLHGPDQRDSGLGNPGDPGPILGLDEPVRHHP